MDIDPCKCFFFFKQKTAYEMRISDWSSDVCSSDLPLNCTVHVTDGTCEVWMGTQVQTRAQRTAAEAAGLPVERVTLHNYMLGGAFGRRLDTDLDRKSVVQGKSVSVRVDLGGCRLIKKKTYTQL